MATTEGTTLPLWKRLGWLVVIWAASVAAVFTVSWVLRLWLKP
jgi:Protein of unknown function (DUF2474)